MRALFATGERFLPDFHGGAECSIDELARELVARGHVCEVLARSTPRSRLRDALWRVATAGRRSARRNRRNGYQTWLARPEHLAAALAERLRALSPDLVVCWNRGCEEIASASAEAGIPALVWVPDVTFRWHRGQLPVGPSVALAGCSQFVVGRIRERLGLPAHLLRPALRLDAYRSARREPELIGLVGARRDKGVDTALAVAALLPDRRFVLLRGEASREDAEVAARARVLPNLTIEPKAAHMREFYARLALLLVPSLCEDAAPRVILEANANGIPVVASARGGIPEVAGDAAILVAPDAPAEAWAAAIEEALEPGRRADREARALKNAARPELGLAAVADGFLALAAELAARARALTT